MIAAVEHRNIRRAGRSRVQIKESVAVTDLAAGGGVAKVRGGRVEHDSSCPAEGHVALDAKHIEGRAGRSGVVQNIEVELPIIHKVNVRISQYAQVTRGRGGCTRIDRSTDGHTTVRDDVTRAGDLAAREDNRGGAAQAGVRLRQVQRAAVDRQLARAEQLHVGRLHGSVNGAVQNPGSRIRYVQRRGVIGLERASGHREMAVLPDLQLTAVVERPCPTGLRQPCVAQQIKRGGVAHSDTAINRGNRVSGQREHRAGQLDARCGQSCRAADRQVAARIKRQSAVK